MRSRLLPLLPALALSFVSCPWTEDAPPRAPRARAAARAAAPAPAPPPPPVAGRRASPPADPALPAGRARRRRLRRPPGSRALAAARARTIAEVDELASTAKETWIFAEPQLEGAAHRLPARGGRACERRAEPAAQEPRLPRGLVSHRASRLRLRGGDGDAQRLGRGRGDLGEAAPARRSALHLRDVALPASALLCAPAQRRGGAPGRARPQGHLRTRGADGARPAFVEPPPAEPVPGVLLYGESAPGLAGGAPRPRGALTLGHARARSGFALLSTFDHEGRRFGLTTELAVLPLDRTRVIKPSTFAASTSTTR